MNLLNLIDSIKHIPDGKEAIMDWVGDGGQVVPVAVAQARADVCNGQNETGKPCPNNQRGLSLTLSVALAVKKYLAIKNGLGLKVRGEKSLGHCMACGGCVLRLLVWEPADKVHKQMDEDEFDKVPGYCWKLWVTEQTGSQHD